MKNRKKTRASRTPRPSRTLTLERLENRSLLAAGVFDFSFEEAHFDHRDRATREGDRNRPGQFDRHSRDEFRNSNRDRAFDGERHLSERNSGERNAGERGRHHRDRNHGRHDLQDATPIKASSTASSDVSVESPTIDDQPVATLTPPLVRIQSPSLRSLSNEGLNSSNANLIDTVFSGLSNSGELPTATSAEPSDSQRSAEPRRTADEQATLIAKTSQETTPNDEPEIVHEREASEAVSVFDSAEPFAGQTLRSTQDTAATHSSELGVGQFEASEGLVELKPLLEWEPRKSSQGSSIDPWELNETVLPLLRQTIHVAQDELAKVTDAVVEDWFNDAGGMVAIDQVRLPLGQFTSDQSFLDVRIESTVMLYRSVELFGAADLASIVMPLPNSVSAPMLDAIMTTLGGLADSDTPPVDEITKSRLSSIAYPVALVAATGAAVSARQKSKRPAHLSIE